MPKPWFIRPVVVASLVAGVLALPASSAGAVPTPRLIRVDESERFIDVDASNDGVVAYAVAAPVSGNPLYTSKVRKTINGGLAWTEQSAAPPGHWSAVSTSADGGVVAIVGFVGPTDYRLFVSTDFGVTFTQKGPTTERFFDVAVSANGGTIAVTRQYVGVSLSTNGGDSWTTVDLDSSDPDPQPLLVENIAISADGTVVSASHYDGSVWRSTDAGQTWIDIAATEPTRLWQDLSMSDDGLTVFGVAYYETQGYVWDGKVSPPVWHPTGSLGFQNGQAVQSAISPDGNTFIAASYSVNPRIFRNWNRTAAPTDWVEVIAGTNVLGLSVTNGGTRFIAVNEGSGIWAYIPEAPGPIVSSISSEGCSGENIGSTAGGTPVTILGNFLFDVSSVTFGGAAASIVSEATTGESVTVLTPPGLPGVVDVVVTTATGATTVSGIFTYKAFDTTSSWPQLGQTLPSLSGSMSYSLGSRIVALNDAGTILAVVTPASEPAGSFDDAVIIRVYEWSGAGWIQRGTDILDIAGDYFVGSSLALSADGNVLAVGSPVISGSGNPDSPPGGVRVFEWSEEADDWTARGSLLEGIDANEAFGFAVALSADGTVLAASAPGNAGGGSPTSIRGQVRVFQWTGTAWMPRGAAMSGATDGAVFGLSISLSADGNVVAGGAPGLDAPSGPGAARGSTQVYEWAGAGWIPRGAPVAGPSFDNLSGWSVDLSADGSTLAVGEPGLESQVRVFDLSTTDWTQRGDAIPVQISGFIGTTVSMNADGTVVAVGGASDDDSCQSSGSVVVHEWQNSSWTSRGGTITTPSGSYGFGASLSLDASGDTIAVAAAFNDAWSGGAVAVFRYQPRYKVFLTPPSPPTPTTPPDSSAPPSTPPSTIPPVIIPSASMIGNLPIINGSNTTNDPGSLVIRGIANNNGANSGSAPRISVRNGQSLRLSISNLLANENVWIGFYSDPLTVAQVVANDQGLVETTIAVPSGLTGDHTLVVYGTDSGRGVRVLVRVAAPTLPRTGSDPAWPMAFVFLGLGLVFVAVASRGRRRMVSHPTIA